LAEMLHVYDLSGC